ncbi:hypothetical protein FB479_11643 [Brevibacillus sp. AG162]|uniref:hypothetical protein n=1 Tax=Brevibacillus sp. AG162 TaxID=2572910 RepID=UPI001152DFBF|nr:hypothetical protein [Brevibacillus sp. AG162]TQK41942.1 hypothetical protein FB479_11643 [Brevibacillus sp. AG162]
MSNQAQFTAMVKKMATDDKKMVLSLELVGNIEPTSLVNVLDMIGEKVTVIMGNPQMAMNFDENEREERQGLSFTTDLSGVVTEIKGGAGEDDHSPEDTDNEKEDGGEEGDGDGSSTEPGDNLGDSSSEQEGDGNGSPSISEEEADSFNESSEEGESGTADDGANEPEKKGETVVATDKEKLEAFILSGQAPAFEETEYDFPALLARKQNGETWIKIASSIGTSSSKLQTAWSKYKKLVAEHMAKNGEEPGAA